LQGETENNGSPFVPPIRRLLLKKYDCTENSRPVVNLTVNVCLGVVIYMTISAVFWDGEELEMKLSSPFSGDNYMRQELSLSNLSLS
jgi:hypothetical protein